MFESKIAAKLLGRDADPLFKEALQLAVAHSGKI